MFMPSVNRLAPPGPGGRSKELLMTIKMPVDNEVLAADTQITTPPLYQRVLIAVADASQVGPVVELARRAGVREARVLHLNLRESYGGRRFPLETDAAASYAAEAAVFELRMGGMAASGHVRHAVIGKAAEAITAEAAQWGADLIILGPSRRGEAATRLLGSVTLHVLQHAPCPVLVASPAGQPDSHRVAAAEHAAVHR
jgi:nucleotide-binding universal stress UspA family protein